MDKGSDENRIKTGPLDRHHSVKRASKTMSLFNKCLVVKDENPWISLYQFSKSTFAPGPLYRYEERDPRAYVSPESVHIYTRSRTIHLVPIFLFHHISITTLTHTHEVTGFTSLSPHLYSLRQAQHRTVAQHKQQTGK